MNFFLPWRKRAAGDTAKAAPRFEYESLLWLESEVLPGVEFSIRKISLAQRLALSSRVLELTLRNEFLRAGEPKDQLEAKIAELLVKRLYVEWAVVEVRGLVIDGEDASLERLLERGPEALVHEMSEAIRTHLELSEDDRKN